MRDRLPTWGTDLTIAVLVGVGVSAAGVYDWLSGRSPESLLPGSSAVRFVIFIGAVAIVVGLAAAAAVGRGPGDWRYPALGAGLLATAVADPTYASLLVAVPLIDVRRRMSGLERTVLSAVTLLLVAVLVLAEQTRRVVAEIEAMFVLGIAFAIVVMFGEALRRMDDARRLETAMARADERNRLAHDLHDSLGHNLLACSIQLRNAAAQQHRNPDEAARSIDLAGRAVAEALADTRLSVDTIRADGDGFSLAHALPELVQRAAPAAMDVEVDLRGDLRRLDQLTQITLYRVAQEALSNVVRHADATAAAIRTDVADGRAVLTVSDDGNGFQPAQGSGAVSGLGTIRERLARVGGALDVQSAKGDGTTLTATVALG